MKKYSLLSCGLLSALILFAQNRDSPAYKTGYAFGKIVGIILIAAFFIWGIGRIGRKK